MLARQPLENEPQGGNWMQTGIASKDTESMNRLNPEI